jgi:hypothetical protein
MVRDMRMACDGLKQRSMGFLCRMHKEVGVS